MFVYGLQPAISNIKYSDDATIFNVVKKSHVTVTDSTARKATIRFSDNPLQLPAVYAPDWCHTNYMLLNATKSMHIYAAKETMINPNADK